MIETFTLVATVAAIGVPTMASATMRCVDGSGLRHHCGTATGGVPGGLPNRN